MTALFDQIACAYDRGMLPLEVLLLRRLRRRLYPFLAGRVLEVGVGTGPNLPLYHPSVSVVAADISEPMLRRAQRRSVRASVHWIQADAAKLPLAADSFDHVAGSLLLCSVPDPRLVLAEIKRVIRPGGWLVLLEHVRGEAGLMRQLTDLLACPWLRLSRGCRLNRDTAEMVRECGFKLVCTVRHGLGVVQMIMARNL